MHPFTKIIGFILVLLFIGMVNHTVLFFMMVVSLLLMFGLKTSIYLHAVRRMRWLFLSMLLIYAFATPGELIPYFPVSLAPTYEGVNSGWLQIERLLIALAALSLLLTRSTKQEMLLGLYMLLYPLRLLGLNVERFAARLLLTLDYVEELAASDNHAFNFNHLDEIDKHMRYLPEQSEVYFEKIPFGLHDKWMLIMFLALFFYLIYQGVA